MAAPRRVELTTARSPFTAPHTGPAAEHSAPHSATVRLDLTLFESDSQNFPEFNYLELVESTKHAEVSFSRFEEEELNEQQEISELAKKLEEKYGRKSKNKVDRVQDLIDIGDGYDEEDSFIDNSEAYDEFVPSSITTKLGGFYVNSGVLHFRALSDSESSEFPDEHQEEKKKQPSKKRKLTSTHGPLKKRCSDQSSPSSELVGEKSQKPKKKKASTLSVTSELKKLEKERERQRLDRCPLQGAGTLALVPADAAGGGFMAFTNSPLCSKGSTKNPTLDCVLSDDSFSDLSFHKASTESLSIESSVTLKGKLCTMSSVPTEPKDELSTMSSAPTDPKDELSSMFSVPRESEGMMFTMSSVPTVSKGKLSTMSSVTGESKDKLSVMSNVTTESKDKPFIMSSDPGESKDVLSTKFSVPTESEGMMSTISSVLTESKDKLSTMSSVSTDPKEELSTKSSVLTELKEKLSNITRVSADPKDVLSTMHSVSDVPTGAVDSSTVSAASGLEGQTNAEDIEPQACPEGFPAELKESISRLLMATKISEGESKTRFYTPEINSILLEIDAHCGKFGGTLRSTVFTHLCSFLPCAKRTLQQRVNKLRKSEENQLMKSLRDAIMKSMPEQVLHWKNTCKAEEQNFNAAEDDQEKGARKNKKLKKNYQWSQEIRESLRRLLKLKLPHVLREHRGLDLDQCLCSVLESDVKPLWPKGWMTSSALISEARSLLDQDCLKNLSESYITAPGDSTAEPLDASPDPAPPQPQPPQTTFTRLPKHSCVSVEGEGSKVGIK